uniref:tryptophan synthase alpha subunit n=1 Tax=Galdieria phlegrea TaxID=1389228 RepID=UPI0023D7CE31|nr:tryptophan synthase alpha subunit [Galdieria phlegrea]UNJ16148.1 tryptophan synthase alpha subunit [Galdieria sp.]WDA99610.1 tryptophan synthase alpha subunit [Galdieria sulphuraria]WDA99800.1 tryptophan synthase alpha subunit [Galdieria phlegrea]
MSLIDKIFAETKSNNKIALMPFIMAGDPNIETTIKVLNVLDKSGSHMIELGVPYSDPLADGIVIQSSAQRALNKGFRINHLFSILENINLSIPIIIFCYFNLILHYGINNFIYKLYQLNVKGIIIPDLPVEETDEILILCQQYNIILNMLVSPVSTESRIKLIVEKTNGFIYLVSSTGVTGIRENFSDAIKDKIQIIRKYSNRPIVIGFGVSKPSHIKQIKAWGADGIIIGSACMQHISKSTEANKLDDFKNFINEMIQAI